jgi:TatD DNase family protein
VKGCEWIDTHCHLSGEALHFEIGSLVERAAQAGVTRLVNICTDTDSLKEGIAAASQFSGFYNAAATTPQDAIEEKDVFFTEVEQAAKEKKLVAIGETGLDYYYGEQTKERQHEYLIRYLHLALKMQLPAIFHCRAAFDDLYAIAQREFSNGRALMHCFTGSKEDARKAIDRGWLISFSGVLTFKKSDALREVAAYVPIEHIVVETDAPYLAPLPYRGKSNEPSYITETGKAIAAIKGISLEECARITTQNARTFFSF